MLCDQASDKIFFIYQTASHRPPVFFYYRIDQLSTARVEINPSPLLLIALGCATLPCTHNSNPNTRGRVFSRVFDARSTRW